MPSRRLVTSATSVTAYSAHSCVHHKIVGVRYVNKLPSDRKDQTLPITTVKCLRQLCLQPGSKQAELH